MPDESRNILDRILIVGSLVGAFAVSFLLWREDIVLHYFVQKRSGEKQIGSIVSAKNDVRRRMQQSLTWYPAQPTETLYERDSLFTGSESEISFRIGESNELQLSADSLVVLETDGSELIFDLRLGSLAANTDGKQKLQLMHAGSLTTVEAGENSNPIKISKSDSGQLKILSSTGSVHVRSGSKNEKINKNEELQIDNKLQWSKQLFPIEMTSHKVMDQVWLEKGEALQLSWASLRPQETQVLQIAKDARFKSKWLEAEKDTFSHNWLPAIQEGDVFVRFFDPVEKKASSAVYKITLLDAGPTRLILPEQNAHLYSHLDISEGEIKKVDFLWTAKREVENYEIQIAKDVEFKTLVGGKTVRQTKYVAQLTSGNYHWRVRSLFGENTHPWSEVRSFNLGQNSGMSEQQKLDVSSLPYGPEKPSLPYGPQLPASQKVLTGGPKPTFKTQKVVLRFDAEKAARTPSGEGLSALNPPKLNWQVNQRDAVYEIEMADNKDFKNPNSISIGSANTYTWSQAKPGRYYWRVKERGRSGSAKIGEPARIDVLVEKPEVIDPKLKSETVTDVDLMDASQNVPVVWKPVPYAKSYRVVEDDVEYDALVTEATVALVPNVQKTLKVAALDDSGRLISDFSTKTLVLERKLAMVIPLPKLPANQTTIVAFSKSKMEPLLFVWSDVDGAEFYDLQFATDAEFGNVLKEESLEKNKFLLKNTLHNGVVYWRVRSRSGSVKSDWSEARTYSIQANP